MLATQIENPTIEQRLTGTSMPDRYWWETLWSQPKTTLQALGLKKGMSVLDLGCGYGHFTIPAAQIAKSSPVIGIDVDVPILSEAKKAGDRFANCLWMNQDLLALPDVMVSKFDYVMMHSTFHGLSDQIEFVRGVVKLLNPGGYFSAINWLPLPRENTIWMGKPRGPKTEMRLSIEQFLQIVRLATPQLVAVQQVILPPYHYGITFQLMAVSARFRRSLNRS
jgi:ubiquinone/menaquinone biosynthesis C-methylase UbiE